MFAAIFFLLAGICAGAVCRKWLSRMPLRKMVFCAILFLLFVMGAQLGMDSSLMDRLPALGGFAGALTVMAMCGSIMAAFLFSRILQKAGSAKKDCDTGQNA